MKATIYKASDVSLRVAGEELIFGGSDAITFEEEPDPDEVAAQAFEKVCSEAGILATRVGRVSETCELTLTLESTAAEWQKLVDAITPPQRGVSDVTLARRAFYGGRKGRGARRRLIARGYNGFQVIVVSGRRFVIPARFVDRKPS